MELRARQPLADRFDWVLDWLYPPRCRGCAERIEGRDRDCFCRRCWAKIERVGRPLCRICGRPFPDGAGGDHCCALCLIRPPQFCEARSWAYYPRQELEDHPLRQAVQRFKYGRKVSLGKPLGRLMAHGCREFLAPWQVDLILAVPLHPKRLRWRGFNQSVLLARQVSHAYGIPMDPLLLRRVKPTPPQTQLSEQERRRNVRAAFVLAPGRSVKDRNILLVDDVYTSGATVNECSRRLKKDGAQHVYVLTLARAVS